MGVRHQVQRRSGIPDDEESEGDAESKIRISKGILKNLLVFVNVKDL